jgi:hypothetical protein
VTDDPIGGGWIPFHGKAGRGRQLDRPPELEDKTLVDVIAGFGNPYTIAVGRQATDICWEDNILYWRLSSVSKNDWIPGGAILPLEWWRIKPQRDIIDFFNEAKP